MNSVLNVTLGVFLITAVIVFLPSGSLPSEVVDAIQNIFGYLYMFDNLFPISDILTILGLYATFELLVYSWKAFNWLIRVLKGS